LAGALLLGAPPEAPAEERDHVLSEVTVDLNGDGQQDRAVLRQAEDDYGELLLYLHDTATNHLSVAVKAPELVFSADEPGRRASLSVTKQGSLQVHSGNESIGRGRWSQTLTIVYRRGAFLIAGITRAERDTLDASAGGSCDLNLMTGKGTRNGAQVRVTMAPVPVTEWTDEKLPLACRFP